MDQTKRQRRVIEGKIERVRNFIQKGMADISSVKRQEVEIRSSHLQDYWKEFWQMQEQIELLCDDTEFDQEIKQREHSEGLQFDLESQIMDLLQVLPARQSEMVTLQTGSSSHPIAAQVKLPRIDLPRFSGSYQQWTSFQDLFVSLVHNNRELTPVQKLFYLKSALDGEAKGLLNAFTSTNANYSEAWQVLIKRYQNKRVIINSHLSTLMNIKPVQGDIPGSLRRLLDTTVENIRALGVQGEPTEHWNSILVHLTTSKVDAETRRQWELSMQDTEVPTFSRLQEFLDQRCRALEAATPTKPPSKYNGRQTIAPKPTSTYHAGIGSCEICKQQHPIYGCEKFIKASVAERIKLIKAKSLCFNCLRGGHTAQACRSSHCRTCKGHHNTLLHREGTAGSAPMMRNAQDGSQATSGNPPPDSNIATHFVADRKPVVQVLLSTIILMIKDRHGHSQRCRALLDMGSQASFITEGCMQRLGLKRKQGEVPIAVLGQGSASKSRGIVTCEFTGLKGDLVYVIEVLVLPKLTGLLPQHTLDPTHWHHIQGLELADPTFFSPGRVDLLLGADIGSELLLPKRKIGPAGAPVAFSTTLGWVLTGRTMDSESEHLTSFHVACELSQQLQRFWEMEELPHSQLLTPAEEFCEAHFKETHTRERSGRYTVRLPIDPKTNMEFGESKAIAIRRLHQVEARLKLRPDAKALYHSFMEEYITLGHMTKSTGSQPMNADEYYIPHHSIVKEHSSTTKLRVVFDASSRSTSGISLNDRLLVGPTVQDGLLAILLRFRVFPYAFTADIEKMFRQIWVHPQDRHNQKIVWRDTTEAAMDEYELNTITYGTASSSYLATRVLRQLAEDEEPGFPTASKMLRGDFYMDDLISGAMSLQEAKEVQKQLIDLLASAGFSLRKWAANQQQLLDHLPLELCDTEESRAFAFDNTVKTLGMLWYPRQDCFSFQPPDHGPEVISKRTILSRSAKLFDPLGWMAPVVIRPKLLMQKLWIAGVSWDGEVPPEVSTEWMVFLNELPMLANIKIPRHLGITSMTDHVELHGFCDASEMAYAAVVYVRVGDVPATTIRMLCTKTKVAPVKQISC